jgi:hypothetical protein
VYDFSWLDTVVDNLLSRGIEVWFNVGYGNPLYMENIPNKTGVGCVPLFFGEACLAAWKNYVAALALHFAGRVKLFEIWNEPEADHFWYPEAPDPKKYAELYDITVTEIRKHIPDAKFAATVASGFDFGFIRGMLSALGGMQVDYFAFHAHSKYPEISFGQGGRYLDNVKLLRSLLDGAGFEKTKLIQGEAGQPSWAPKGHWLYKDGFDNPRAQAVWLLRRFVLDHFAEVAISSFFMIADIWEKPYETATQILPRDPMLPRRDPLRFQYEVSLWQYMEEDRGIERLLLHPAPLKVQITDRGVADAYIYLNAEQVALMTDQSPDELGSRYTAVLYFAPYRSEKLTDGNEFRVEREDEMAALEAKTRGIWSGHPHLYEIPTFDTIEERIAYTKCVLEQHIGKTIFQPNAQAAFAAH